MTVQQAAEKLGGRKIVVWVVSVIVSTFLLWFGRIDGAQWKELHVWTTMSLLAANAFTHFAQSFRK